MTIPFYTISLMVNHYRAYGQHSLGFTGYIFVDLGIFRGYNYNIDDFKGVPDERSYVFRGESS